MENKNSIEHVFRVRKTENPETGNVTLSPDNDSWGPVVSASTIEEAELEFKHAFKVSLIIKSLFSIKKMIGSHTEPSKDDIVDSVRCIEELKHAYAVA
jgi:hypothetical protein